MLARNQPNRPTEPLAERDDEGSTMTLLTIRGDHAKIEGKFEIADSLEIQCEVGGELEVGGKLVIGERGVVSADVRTVDAVIMGSYEGNMVATGNVEIAATGHVTGNLQTDSLVINRGGFFNGNVTKIKEAESGRSFVIEERIEDRFEPAKKEEEEESSTQE